MQVQVLLSSPRAVSLLVRIPPRHGGEVGPIPAQPAIKVGWQRGYAEGCKPLYGGSNPSPISKSFIYNPCPIYSFRSKPLLRSSGISYIADTESGVHPRVLLPKWWAGWQPVGVCSATTMPCGV